MSLVASAFLDPGVLPSLFHGLLPAVLLGPLFTPLFTPLFGVASPAPAVQAPSPAAAVAEPMVVLEGPAGRVGEKPISALDIADPRLLGAHLVRFPVRASAAQAAPPEPADDALECTLSSGERVRGVLVAKGEESLTIRCAGNARATLALEEVAALRYPARIPATWFAPIERPPEGDRVYRRKGDTLERIDGSVEAFSAEAIQFHGALVGSLSVPWSELAALFVEALGAKDKRAGSKLVPLVVDLVDGTRLRGGLVKLDPAGLLLERAGGDQVLCPHPALALALVEDGVLRFLSDVPASSAPASTPFGDTLGLSWPARVDASVMGTPLAAGGQRFARGLGVHAPSRMEWKLDGSAEILRGRIAIDDDALRLSARGSAVFRVVVDGAKRFESPKLRAGDAPVAFSVDGLTGAKVLVLEVDPAGDSFAGDRADWLELVLVAPKKK